MVGHCCDGVYCGAVVDLLDVVLQAAAGVGGCDECPEAFAFQELVDQVLGWKVGCVKGGAVYANLVPMEDDCNATASLFVRGRHPGQVEAILDSEDAPLARSLTPPGSATTLATRTVCFLHLFADLCEDPAAPRHVRTVRRDSGKSAGGQRSCLDSAAERWPLHR